jgi:hypothetical protein
VSRVHVWSVHLANLLVAGTGLVYAWMRYAMEPSDPYAIVAHPAQPLVQHAHIWTAPFLVFTLGLVWHQHVWRHFHRGSSRRRLTGITLLATAAPMVLSGYLLQTAVSQGWRTTWVVLHLGTSAVWIAGAIGHALGKRDSDQAPPRD